MRPPSLPRILFLLCYTPGLFQKAPVWSKAFSSSLYVCGMNPAVARASKHFYFAPSVSVHTRMHLNWVFVTFAPCETSRFHPPGQTPAKKRLFLYMPSLRWQQYHMHFALKLKLAFSITLLLLGCFDVFSKGQVCVCARVCSDSSHSCVSVFV